MKQWLQAREPREQLLLGVGALVVVIVLVYWALLSPLTHATARAKQQLQRQQLLYTWMQPRVTQLIALRKGGDKPIKNTDSALVIIENKLNQSALNDFASSVTLTQQRQVKLNFKQVPFNSLMHWLHRLYRTHGIQVQQLSVKSREQVGEVEASITLR